MQVSPVTVLRLAKVRHRVFDAGDLLPERSRLLPQLIHGMRGQALGLYRITPRFDTRLEPISLRSERRYTLRDLGFGFDTDLF